MRYNADCYQKRAAKLFFSRESRHHSVRDTYDYEYVTRTAQAHIAFCNNVGRPNVITLRHDVTIRWENLTWTQKLWVVGLI